MSQFHEDYLKPIIQHMEKFQVITLCGSLRFTSRFVAVQIALERFGHVCFSITAGEHAIPPTPEQKSILDKVHFKKIAMSDCIFVIDCNAWPEYSLNTYIGESTRNEIEYARLNNKPVYYLSQGHINIFL